MSARTLLTWLCLAWSSTALAEPSVAVVVDADSPAARAVVDGLRAELDASGLTVRVSVGWGESATRAGDVTVAVGPRSLDRLDGTPDLVAVLVIADDLERHPGAIGVVLDHPPEVWLDLIAAVVPEARTLGVLHGTPVPAGALALALEAARSRGYAIESRSVPNPTALPEQLRSLANRVDVLWGLPDADVYTRQSAEPILLFSFRSRVPMIGLSQAWVDAGAVVSPEWDMGDLGHQTGALVLALLRGESPPRVVRPRNVRYVVNERSAVHHHLVLPRRLAEGRDER